MGSVRFFSEHTRFRLSHPRKTLNWIKSSVKNERKDILALNLIFCTDEYLRVLNAEYLNHKDYTDVVTFNYSEVPKLLEGDIFISIDRVKENSTKLKVSFDTELHRVMIHGVLHLMGYSDKSAREKSQMREKEDAYLSLR
jgi:rRNA maturation RNase YbeY